eukprot:CAMPEP_0168628650 /NCGR_PEP_ID=MMETSP0449_2-20121227/11964_1 /TAXON_ID=1082188 /ORGANISM="Strombidium rassoulzadegani, Strain ras09" /LENGTH=65 /DNA_ID=CAMNT_0008671097 /DNA_START=1238 /DNA_END=1435 /DNA_ORIENTATION=-
MTLNYGNKLCDFPKFALINTYLSVPEGYRLVYMDEFLNDWTFRKRVQDFIGTYQPTSLVNGEIAG